MYGNNKIKIHITDYNNETDRIYNNCTLMKKYGFGIYDSKPTFCCRILKRLGVLLHD